MTVGTTGIAGDLLALGNAPIVSGCCCSARLAATPVSKATPVVQKPGMEWQLGGKNDPLTSMSMLQSSDIVGSITTHQCHKAQIVQLDYHLFFLFR